MARYTTIGTQTGATDATILGLTGGTGVRPRIYDVNVGTSSSPLDNAALLYLQRTTAAGSGGTTPTPTPHDPADPTAEVTAVSDPTSEPTYTATEVLLDIPLNQQVTFHYFTLPEEGFIIPATANAGVGLKTSTVTQSGATYNAHIMHQE